MGREHEFSIHYEFKIDLEQINNLTTLLTRDRDCRDMKLHSDVSPESFALACQHLNGQEITVTNSNISDLQLLANELKCPSLLELVKDYARRTTKFEFSTTLKEMDEHIFECKTSYNSSKDMWEQTKKENIAAIKRCLAHNRKATVETYSLGTEDIIFSDKMDQDDLECLNSYMDILASLKSEIEISQEASKLALQFQAEQKASSLSAAENIEETLKCKADYGDSWCQLHLGKHLNEKDPELSMKYLSMASRDGRFLEPIDLAKMYISGSEITQDFNRAVECIRESSDEETRQLRDEIIQFNKIISDYEFKRIDADHFGHVIDNLDTLVLPKFGNSTVCREH